MSRSKTNPTETAKETFIQEIRVRRAYLDMTQSELATAIGVVPSSMSKLISNPDKISVGRLRGIIKALNLEPLIVLKLLGYSQKDVIEFRQRVLIKK